MRLRNGAFIPAQQSPKDLVEFELSVGHFFDDPKVQSGGYPNEGGECGQQLAGYSAVED